MLNQSKKEVINTLIFIPNTTLYLNAIPKDDAAHNEKNHVPVYCASPMCISILYHAVLCSLGLEFFLSEMPDVGSDELLHVNDENHFLIG